MLGKGEAGVGVGGVAGGQGVVVSSAWGTAVCCAKRVVVGADDTVAVASAVGEAVGRATVTTSCGASPATCSDMAGSGFVGKQALRMSNKGTVTIMSQLKRLFGSNCIIGLFPGKKLVR
jgi:hypothetical protein